MDYMIPTSLDLPEMEPIIVGSVDPYGPFRAKEAGLADGGGVEAVRVNAIYDAFGVRIREVPVDPSHILKALKKEPINGDQD